MVTRTRLIKRSGVLLLGCMALALLSPASADAGDWWGDLDKGDVVQLADVMAKPMDYRGRQLTFVCITSGKANVFFQESAILSRQRYTNYAVWPDGTVVWRKRDFVQNDFPFLFIAKNHFQHDALLGLRKFTRIEVTGTIKAILRQKPHIEVTSFRETSHRLGARIYDAMVRGDRYYDASEMDLAIEKYRSALRPDLPETYALVIRKQLAAVLREVGRGGEAAEVEQGRILTREDFAPDSPDGVNPGGFPPPARGDEGAAPAGGTLPNPFDDMPGAPVFPDDTPQPDGFPQPDVVPDPTRAPVGPAPQRNARANPFLDEELPGTSDAVPPQPRTHWDTGGVSRRAAPAQPGGRTAVGSPDDPAPSGFGSPDLPGSPINPLPTNPPPTGVAPRGNVTPRTPATPPSNAPTARRGAPRGAPALPPKRRPRLAGVK